MPRSKAGVTKEPVNRDNLTKAVKSVLATSDEDHLSYNDACKIYKIKRGTLHRHVTKFKNANQEEFTYTNQCNYRQVFSEEEEKDLIDYIKVRARLNYGLSRHSVRKLAFDYAKAKGKAYPKSWEEQKSAGETWLKIFMKKYKKDISLRKPEATSVSRSTAFNRPNVQKYFDNLTACHTKHGPFPPERIYNVDESGLSTVQTPPKIVAPTGSKQVSSVTSAERGTNVTLICAINAVGNHIPPMFVFPRIKFQEFMIINAPPGSDGAANPSGWSNDEIFLKFMDHFIKFTKPSPTGKILLILDNHSSHCTLEAIDKARSNGIVLLTFPPHTSHKLQPLDRTVFGPLKVFYNRALNEWQLSNPAKRVTIYTVPLILSKVYNDAFNGRNITSGFRCSGIYPMDSNIFSDDEYLPSYVTDRPAPEQQVAKNIAEANAPTQEESEAVTPGHVIASSSDTPGPVVAGSSSEILSPVIASPSSETPVSVIASPSSETPVSVIASPSSGTPSLIIAGPSFATPRSVSANSSSKSQNLPIAGTLTKTITPEHVCPLPKASEQKVPSQQRGRKSGKTRILTDTPERLQIAADKEKKAKKRLPKSKDKPKPKKQEAVRKLSFEAAIDDEDSMSSDMEINYGDSFDDSEEISDKEEFEQLSNYSVGDFVMVKFESKKSKSHYIGEIRSAKNEDEEYNVKFLKRLKRSNVFIFDCEEPYLVCQEDVLFKMPKLNIAGSSTRLQGQYKFNISFDKFNVL